MPFSDFVGSGGGGSIRDSNGHEHGSGAGANCDEATGSGIPGFVIPLILFAQEFANGWIFGSAPQGARDDHSPGDRGSLRELKACRGTGGYAYKGRKSAVSCRRRVSNEESI